MRKTLKSHILKVASELFYNNGIQATGVDTIIAEAKVAKMTLYKHFPSKDDLILAYLTERDKEWRAWLEQSVDQIASKPAEKIIGIFDVLDIWFRGPDFNGCAFLNTTAEFTGVSHPFHEASIEHKKHLLEYINKLVEDAGIQQSTQVADSLYLLIEGAIITELVHRDGKSAKRAKEAARASLSSYNK